MTKPLSCVVPPARTVPPDWQPCSPPERLPEGLSAVPMVSPPAPRTVRVSLVAHWVIAFRHKHLRQGRGVGFFVRRREVGKQAGRRGAYRSSEETARVTTRCP